MAIAGILVYTAPGTTNDVRTLLEQDACICEVRTTEESDLLAAVLEAPSNRINKECERVGAIEGVLSLGLAYMSYEDDIEETGAVPCPKWEPKRREAR